MKQTKIILASASPRRRELLAQIGAAFEVRVSNVEEKVTAVEPGAIVEELSRQKAEAVLEGLQNQIGEGEEPEDVLIIGADTVVAIDGRILGKPADEKEAVEMLEQLSGRCHEVYTGVTLLHGTWEQGTGAEGSLGKGSPEEGSQGKGSLEEGTGAGIRLVRRRTFHEMTKVTFYPMTKEEISFYVSSGDCMDKAGAYGIQGVCARYIKGIEGDYNNVVGLPAGRLYQEIKEWMEV